MKSKSSVGYPFPNNRHYRTTGIDLKYWHHYQKVRDVTGLIVKILFVHYNEREIRSGTLDELNVHPKKYVNNGTGMIYWPYDDLKIIARIDDEGQIF